MVPPPGVASGGIPPPGLMGVPSPAVVSHPGVMGANSGVSTPPHVMMGGTPTVFGAESEYSVLIVHPC